MSVKMDQLINMNSKGATPQEESAQSLVLTLGSRLTTTKAEKQFARLRVKFTYCGHYTYIEGQQDVPTFSWPEAATEDSDTTAACELQTNYMPEGVMVIAVQSGTWMGHDWPEAKAQKRRRDDAGSEEVAEVVTLKEKQVAKVRQQLHTAYGDHRAARPSALYSGAFMRQNQTWRGPRYHQKQGRRQPLAGLFSMQISLRPAIDILDQ